MNDRTDQDKQGQTAVGPTSSIADAKRSAVNRRNMLLGGTTLAAAAIGASAPLTIAQAQAPQQPAPSAGKPNILVIFGDDVGITNISHYSNGLMGYETPNIDRIGREGITFLHYYGEQSCTAGRAAFLTGQHGIRTGLTKVGFPGAPMGMSQLDPTIGGLLKNLGYATGQFGKNHVGDRNETLPTVNGFDEFFGNLYHLNAEEEPELPNYPKDPAYRAKFGPRGVLRCRATDRDDPTIDPRPVPGSAGKVVSGAQMRIVDENGADVPPGTPGEALWKAPALFLGYWADDITTTAALTTDGWYRTKDLVRVDENGYVFVVGRLSDMIIRGGSNVSPSEVEAVIREHPSIAAVAVVGVHDDTYGQAVVAAVQPTNPDSFEPGTITAYCRDRLAGYKVPTQIVIVKEFPLNRRTAKIDRSRLARELSTLERTP